MRLSSGSGRMAACGSSPAWGKNPNSFGRMICTCCSLPSEARKSKNGRRPRRSLPASTAFACPEERRCPLFTLPFSVSQLHHISGSRYLVEGVIDAANPDYYRMDPEGREKVAKAHQENQDYEVLDEIPFWFNGQGFLCKKRTALFDYDVETGALRRLTAPLFSLDSLAIVGQTAYFLGEEYRTKPTGHDSLWKLEGSELRCLSAQLPVQGGQLLSVGERLLLLGSEGLRHGLNENDFVYTVDTETGALSLLRAEEENMYSSVGSDCRYGGANPAKSGEKTCST